MEIQQYQQAPYCLLVEQAIQDWITTLGTTTPDDTTYKKFEDITYKKSLLYVHA